MEVNGNYWFNGSNWQAIKVPKEKNYPAWSMRNFTPEKEVMKKGKPERCAYCKRISIPHAFHPAKRKIRFCSWQHGKEYMRNFPDVRYVSELYLVEQSSR